MLAEGAAKTRQTQSFERCSFAAQAWQESVQELAWTLLKFESCELRSLPVPWKEGNRRFVDGRPFGSRTKHAARRQLVDEGQAPHTAIIGCADSRAPLEMIFDAMPGQRLGQGFCSNHGEVVWFVCHRRWGFKVLGSSWLYVHPFKALCEATSLLCATQGTPAHTLKGAWLARLSSALASWEAAWFWSLDIPSAEPSMELRRPSWMLRMLRSERQDRPWKVCCKALALWLNKLHRRLGPALAQMMWQPMRSRWTCSTLSISCWNIRTPSERVWGQGKCRLKVASTNWRPAP